MSQTTTEGVDERIRHAAVSVLRERGYAALSMEGVAADAGVAKTTVYRRYRNKADLATAALANHAGPVPEPADDVDARTAVLEFLTAFATRFEAMGLDVLGSMLAEHDPELLELHRERVVEPRSRAAVALLERGQERGEVRADLDARLALEMMVGSFFSRHIAGREMAPAKWAEAVVETLWRGLEP
ncbi:MAG: TetR/AcrR family transcriptional regulator [Thermoleophilaceae bacterium]